MNVNSALQTGLQGVQRGQEGMLEAANEIVKVTTEPTAENSNVIEPMVDLKLYEQTVEASLQVVKAADETLGTLLDAMA
jgi:hypothetical protein